MEEKIQKKRERESSIIMCCHTEKLGLVFPYKRNAKYKVFHMVVHVKPLLWSPMASLKLHLNNESEKHK